MLHCKKQRKNRKPNTKFNVIIFYYFKGRNISGERFLLFVKLNTYFPQIFKTK